MPHQENVQQDATSICGQLEHHYIGTSEMQARAAGSGLSQQMQLCKGV
jgi:hypothetical protein